MGPGRSGGGTADGSWMTWTAIGLGGIWLAVLLDQRVLAPDLVSGSGESISPSPRSLTWFWGGVGTLVFLWAMGKLRGDARWRSIWIGLAAVTLTWRGPSRRFWPSACRCSSLGRSCATRIPIEGAFFAPVAAAMLTALAGVVTSVLPERGSRTGAAGRARVPRVPTNRARGPPDARCGPGPRVSQFGQRSPASSSRYSRMLTPRRHAACPTDQPA